MLQMMGTDRSWGSSQGDRSAAGIASTEKALVEEKIDKVDQLEGL